MHNSTGRRIATDASGKYILSCSDDKTARLWDASSGELLNTYRIPIGDGREGRIQACAISVDGKVIALAGQTGFEWDKSYCIYLLNIQTGELISRIKDLPAVINDIEFSKDGKWMAAGLGNKKGVIVFNTANWTMIKALENYDASVYNISFNPKGGLATVCYDGKLRMYNEEFEIQAEKSGLAGQQIYSVTFNPSGSLLAIGYNDSSSVEVRSVADLSVLYRPSIKEAEDQIGLFGILSFSNDGRHLYGGGRFMKQQKDGKWKFAVRNWSDAGKGNFSDIELFSNAIIDIKPLPDGSMAVLGSYPDIAKISAAGQPNWFLSANKMDFNANDRSHFRISDDGLTVGFTPLNQHALSFDLKERRLEEKQESFSSYTDSAAGTIVTNWNKSPGTLINGKKISFFNQNESCYSTDITKNGEQIILGGQFNLYLSNSKAEMLWKTSLPAIAVSVKINSNEKIVAAALSDGTIRWYSMADGKELLIFYLHPDKKRWVLFTASGYYDASPGAEDFLGWHFNNGADKKPSFYPVSRFREKFYRRDIINAIFETYNETQAISLANQRRGTENLPAELTIQKLPPTISIISPENGSSVNTNLVSISYNINSPDDVPAKKIKVFVDGRPIPLGRGGEVENKGLQKIDVTIPEKDCRISFVAENENGTSPEVTLYIKWTKTKEAVSVKPNLYVLAIGISNYSKVKKLGLAAKDAEDFSKAVLQQKGKLYNDVIVKTLTDKEASKENILDGLEWIEKKTGKKDVAMIYFAGHGVNDDKDIYYMLPVEADRDRLKATCISFSAIKETQSHIEGKVILFIDACHSGNILGGNYINGVVNLLTGTVNGAGAIVFTSSTGNQESLEDPRWGNGAFTKALVEGISGKAILDKKNEISYLSLGLYLSERVSEITGNRQQTTCVPAANTPNFAIASVK